MSNVRLTWTLPTVTPRQRPIAHVRVSFRVDAALPWTVQDTVPAANPQELLFADVAPGTYFYQAVVVDTDGNVGPPVETQADVPFDAPSAVTGLVAAVE